MAARLRSKGFGSPGPVPREALDYIRHKEWRVGFNHLDVFREEHAFFFTVAKAMQVDILQTIRGEVENAIAEGGTLRQFRRDLEPTLQRLGWWGVKEEADPAGGEIRPVQLGSPRRLKTIYDTNLRAARAAGQEERMQRTKEALPYALYSLGPSAEHRPEHAAWHGVLLPIDDPWWDTHTPQLGFGCKCRKRQVGEREAAKLRAEGVLDPTAPPKLNPDTGLPTGKREKRYTPVQTEAPPIRYREWVNRRTGEVLNVPVGIDPGFDVNPGKVRRAAADAILGGKLMQAPPEIRAVVLRDIRSRAGELDAIFRGWAEALLGRTNAAGTIMTTGETIAVGHLTGPVVDGLIAIGEAPVTTAITVSDKQWLHLQHLEEPGRTKRTDAKGVLNREEALRLPQLLRDKRAAVWDTASRSLLYVVDVERAGQIGKIAVKINFRERGGMGNSVRTAGVETEGEIKQGRRYLLLEGEW